MSPDDDTAEHVAPQLVGPEPVIGRGRVEGAEKIDGIGIVGHHQLAEGRAEYPESDDDGTGEEGGRAQQQLQPLAPGRLRAGSVPGGRGLGSGGHSPAPKRMRGFNIE